MSGISSNLFPFKASLSRWSRKKSEGLRCGKCSIGLRSGLWEGVFITFGQLSIAAKALYCEQSVLDHCLGTTDSPPRFPVSQHSGAQILF
ncbi:hypothetical protein TNCV_499951 [Trichonephila clavipes]|nr:hypothetical protein TNCV_499951 [Trichonephila clavipes]